MMKMHSYCAHNGMLSDIYRTLKKEERRLSDLLARQPDAGAAIREEADKNRAEQLVKFKTGGEDAGPLAALKESGVNGSSSIPGTPLPIGTPAIPAGATAVSTGYISHADVVKMRLGGKGRVDSSASTLSETSTTGDASFGKSSSLSVDAAGGARSRAASVASEIPLGTSLEPTHSVPGAAREKDAHPLSYSSDKLVSTLASNIDAMRAELTSQGSDDATTAGIEAGEGKAIVWPANVGWKEYWIFMCMPTLCYQLSYPRTTTLVPAWSIHLHRVN